MAALDWSQCSAVESIPDPIAAQNYALNYSGLDGAKNDNNKLPSVSTTVQTKCLSFAPCNPVNTVVVEQTTVVPTIFAKVLGIDRFTIKAKATACSPCSSKPLDIMLVLDRTGSMCQFSNGTSDPACTDLNNAKNGLLEFVNDVFTEMSQPEARPHERRRSHLRDQPGPWRVRALPPAHPSRARFQTPLGAHGDRRGLRRAGRRHRRSAAPPLTDLPCPE